MGSMLFCILSVAISFQSGSILLAIEACCKFGTCDRGSGGLNCCGTDGTIRRCNAVCCNCEGGCSGSGGYWPGGREATGRRRRRDTRRDRENAAATFDRIDTNADGVLSYEEAFVELNSTGLYKAYMHGSASWFEDMDKDGNDRIEPGEFDWHLL